MVEDPLREPVVGWRAWNLSDDRSGPVLWPAGSGEDPWPRRQPLEARCRTPRVLTGRFGRHEAPAVDCRCGVYAGDRLDVVVPRGWPAWPPAPVIGRVALWGRVMVHQQGWRARFAYPDRLGLVCVVCAWVEPGPGVPAVVHAFGRRLYPFCEMHAGGIEVPDGRRTRPADVDPAGVQGRLLDAYAVDPLPAESLEPLFRRPATPPMPAYLPSIRLVRTASAPDG